VKVEMMDLITIIIPVYNAEKYIESCIKSVLQQTYTNLQIVLIDDGSSDKSKQICDEYANVDKRIEVVHKVNGGVSSARNSGIQITRGKYLCFIDADDVVNKNIIQMLYTNLISNNSDMSMCGHATVEIDYNTEKLTYHRPPHFSGDTKGFLKKIDVFLSAESVQGPCAKLLKTSIVTDNKVIFPLDFSFGEDTIFVYNYIKYTTSISSFSDVLYFYKKVNANSLSSKDDNNRIDTYIYLFDKLSKLLTEFDVPNVNLIEYRLCIASIACINELYQSTVLPLHKIRVDNIEKILNKDEIIKSFYNQKNTNFKFFILNIFINERYNVIDSMFLIMRFFHNFNLRTLKKTDSI
jgi:glycosyltransferase involved in cell wall biosynthesis